MLNRYIILRILQDEDNPTFVVQTIRETAKPLLRAENTTSREVMVEKTLLLIGAACKTIIPTHLQELLLHEIAHGHGDTAVQHICLSLLFTFYPR